MIADEDTSLSCGTSSRRAGTRALPDLHPANAGLEMLFQGACIDPITQG